MTGEYQEVYRLWPAAIRDAACVETPAVPDWAPPANRPDVLVDGPDSVMKFQGE